MLSVFSGITITIYCLVFVIESYRANSINEPTSKKFNSKSYHSKCTDSIYSWGRNANMTILGGEKACALGAKRDKRCYLEGKVDTTDKSGKNKSYELTRKK